VTIVSEEELLVDPTYKNSPYLVLIGRLDAGNETVGNITKNILENTGENTTQMLDSGHDFFAVKYGIWNKTQTVVMLSHPYRLDHLIVLNILKSMWKSVNGSSVEIQFPTPRRSFRIDAIQEIDTQIWVELNESITPWMKITKYNTSTTPNAVTHTLGLGSNHKALGLYIEINVSENIQNETSNIIDDAWIILYYTASDLDRTGDGDGDDEGDIKESSLKLYFYHEDTGKWKALSKNMDWVYETGVDTTNVELYGKNYEGYIWAHVSHFSLYGVAGEVKSPAYPPMKNIPPMADASASEQFGFVNSHVIFDGSQSTDDGTILSYVWDFGDGNTGNGQLSAHIYSETGTYTVTLTITDDNGATDTDTVTVTIVEANNPPTTPIIDGPNFGHINTEYNYDVVSTDLDSNSIRYIVYWDDGQSNTSLFFANNTRVTMSHSWDTAGAYRVAIYSEDENNALSGTAILTVFIDVIAKPIEDVIEGYLVDNNNDGTYDFRRRKKC
jgi:PKD repeat protein